MTPAGHWDWDAIYREGTPVWETGEPSAELIRFLDEKRIGRGSVLDVGCGTGADAIYMVRRGLEVTAVDSSPTAIERARVRAEQEDALPRFVLADFFEFAQSAGTFDFVYDAGFYHYARQIDLDRYLDGLWRVTRPGSYYMTLAAGSRRADRRQSAAGHQAPALQRAGPFVRGRATGADPHAQSRS